MKKSIILFLLLSFCLIPVNSFAAESGFIIKGKCNGMNCHCESNDDCAKDEYCNDDGLCMFGCRHNEDCPPEQFCQDHACVANCIGNTSSAGEFCEATTPLCFTAIDQHESYCACDDNSCHTGTECVTVKGQKSCEPCAAGSRCNCPSGYKADGASNCIPCEMGESCGCPENYTTNIHGICVRCNVDTECPFGHQCHNQGKTNSTCEPFSCSYGKYQDAHSCELCSLVLSHCKACTAKDKCTNCEDGYAPAYGFCSKCSDIFGDLNCKECSETKCTACKPGYYIENGKCERIVCDKGLYLNKEGVCVPCPKECSECSSENLCSECSQGYEKTNDDKFCKKIECPEGSYFGGTLCMPCLPNCAKCTNSNDCQACAVGHVFNKEIGVCQETLCPKGFRKDYIDGECKKCTIEHCIDCGEKECYFCEKGYVFKDDKCVPEKCPPNCNKCSEIGVCEECKVDTSLIDGICRRILCGKGKYLENGKCKACLPGCKNCTDKHHCKVCESNEFYLENGYCRKCNTITSNCKTCNSSKKCTSCTVGTLTDGICTNN